MVGGGEEAMEAVAADQVSMMSSREQQSNIVKGKRTKRQRPQSPIPFVVSTSGDGGATHDHDHKSLSPASSTEYMGSTEEDEDMANCLILLAQCQSRESPKQQPEDDINVVQNKFNSRRFLEAPSSGNGKAGYYVYECKTCNRTFPSFQALGGHRASHKKPKTTINHDERRSNFIVSSDEEEGNFKNIFQFSHINNNNNSRANMYSSNNNRSGKVHECSICGAEFTSGQALGGHMRRHRAPVGTNTTLSLTPMASSSEDPRKPKTVLSLDLDLNLPAPEDDLRESKTPFASKQQQQQQKSALVFSAPTLVDCHY